MPEYVNDKHSMLNETLVAERIVVDSLEALQSTVLGARASGAKICVAGGRHAMGGQQFAAGGLLIDTSELNRVLYLDRANRTVEVESGVRWPQLVAYLRRDGGNLAIRQKQTGCDSLSIGGAISANIHGRGLGQAPFVSDVEEFKIVTAGGELLRCSRRENSRLFSLVAGGYGLFGLIYSATLRLAPRRRLRRSVQLVRSTDAVSSLERSIAGGVTHGDFQFNIDDSDDDFLQSGILSTYAPCALEDEDETALLQELAESDWRELLYLAHSDKGAAYAKYVKHYLATDGQKYWSDTFQLSTYVDGYHGEVDRRLCSSHRGSELISELYVPRSKLGTFLGKAADFLRGVGASVIYGTVRLIERDDETFLPWAREPWACIVFNLHVEHSPTGFDSAGIAFRGLIDLAIDLGGSYYLTYHRFADRRQIVSCYPQIAKFLQEKKWFDPDELFISDWYKYLNNLLHCQAANTLPISRLKVGA